MSEANESAKQQDSSTTIATVQTAPTSTTGEQWISGLIGASVFVAVGASFLASWLGIGSPRLEVVTAAQRDATQQWILAGRVITSDGAPAPKASVWAIASDDRGNRYTPASVVTDETGQFTIAPIPNVLGTSNEEVTNNVSVYAQKTLSSGEDTQTITGRDTLVLNREGRVRWITPSPYALSLVAVIFVISIVGGLAQVSPTRYAYKKVKYYSLVCLSFLFTFTIIGYISVGLRAVNVTGRPGEVIALGFANLYHGTYVKDLQPEWLFSLTSPGNEDAQTTEEAARGFGAPLWSMLLSVIGGAVFTISLLVKQVTEPVQFENDKDFRERVGELLRHQFYMLFAPLGAVVVYQLLVTAGAASEQITVGLAMLGAGVALNPLLDKALKTAEGILD